MSKVSGTQQFIMARRDYARVRATALTSTIVTGVVAAALCAMGFVAVRAAAKSDAGARSKNAQLRTFGVVMLVCAALLAAGAGVPAVLGYTWAGQGTGVQAIVGCAHEESHGSPQGGGGATDKHAS